MCTYIACWNFKYSHLKIKMIYNYQDNKNVQELDTCLDFGYSHLASWCSETARIVVISDIEKKKHKKSKGRAHAKIHSEKSERIDSNFSKNTNTRVRQK